MELPRITPYQIIWYKSKTKYKPNNTLTSSLRKQKNKLENITSNYFIKTKNVLDDLSHSYPVNKCKSAKFIKLQKNWMNGKK